MKINKTHKYQRYKRKLQQRKKVAVTVIVIGATAITLNLFGVFDYLEAKSVDLVSFKEEIKYEDISDLSVIEVYNIETFENDLYLVQQHEGVFKIKYYDVETKKKLFEVKNDEMFFCENYFEELNGKILNFESFYKYVNAVDTLKSSYTSSEFMEIWEKTKEHYQNMKRLDKEDEKKKEYYKYGYIFY